MNPPAVTPAERDSLSTYQRGYIDGLYAFAWHKDGVLYVGTTGKTYAQAVDEYLKRQGRR